VTTWLDAGGQELRTRQVYDRIEPSWTVERYIKDFNRDWPVYKAYALADPDMLDWSPVREALAAVGEDYLLEVYLGNAFVDFAGGQREGGLEQVLLDLVDRPNEMRGLQDEYIDYMRRLVRAVLAHTQARSLFIGSIWSSLSLLSPRVWRAWDLPVLRAVVEEAHALGGLVHHHFHGRCLGVLTDLAGLGLDCICPFERPPGGDVTGLAPVAQGLAGRTAFNGNVHTVETLIRGTPAAVEREVLEILAAFDGPHRNRLIVGTGDQVGWETPDDNIWAMIETVKRYGTAGGSP
jgi:uroporphyrinogen-III decarboxylase